MKRIMIWIVVIVLAWLFYKKFMAETFEGFFSEKKGTVDFMGLTTPTIDKVMSDKKLGTQ